jgi:hypothetical protein
VPFSATTTHQHDFRRWELAKAEAPAPSVRVPSSTPFSGVSTYKDAYQASRLPERPQPQPHPPVRNWAGCLRAGNCAGCWNLSR